MKSTYKKIAYFFLACILFQNLSANSNLVRSLILPGWGELKMEETKRASFLMAADLSIFVTYLLGKNFNASYIDQYKAYGSLYASFEEVAMNEASLADAGFEGEWIKEFLEIAIENIIPPFVEIKGSLNLSVNSENGVEVIKEALLSAEKYSSEKDEISVMCYYDGAPEYRMVLKAPDFKTAEDLWIEVSKSVVSIIEENDGQVVCYRD